VRLGQVGQIAADAAKSGGNQRRAAEILGLHRPSLTRMIRELGIREAEEPRGVGSSHAGTRAPLGASSGREEDR